MLIQAADKFLKTMRVLHVRNNGCTTQASTSCPFPLSVHLDQGGCLQDASFVQVPGRSPDRDTLPQLEMQGPKLNPGILIIYIYIELQENAV